jgi:hypothetical protein
MFPSISGIPDMKPKGKRPGLLSRKLDASEVIESLCQDGTLQSVVHHGKRVFKFNDRWCLYSIDELLRLLETLKAEWWLYSRFRSA